MDASTPSSPVAACWSCGLFIDRSDRYCRSCGKGQGGNVPWYYRHWGIILMTLFGLGPFSLVLVWRSPLLSPLAKWVYTAIIVAGTVFIGYRMYQIWLLLSSTLQSALSVYSQTLRF